MTPEEFRDKMNIMQSLGQEEGHMSMDDLMCELLSALGYHEGVEIFEKFDKWYS
jgi:hypothetical protein